MYRALKLRYLLPIVAPAPPIKDVGSGKPTPSPSITRFPSGSTEPPIYFDAALVARKEENWEIMLENVVCKWMDAVVEERRGER